MSAHLGSTLCVEHILSNLELEGDRVVLEGGKLGLLSPRGEAIGLAASSSSRSW